MVVAEAINPRVLMAMLVDLTCQMNLDTTFSHKLLVVEPEEAVSPPVLVAILAVAALAAVVPYMIHIIVLAPQIMGMEP